MPNVNATKVTQQQFLQGIQDLDFTWIKLKLMDAEEGLGW